MLASHQAVRAAAGVPPLTWSDRLAADARAHAQALARGGGMAHAERRMGAANDQGENLWTGSRGTFRLEEMAAAWADERRDFVARPVPMSSRTGRFDAVSHYVQMVWRATKEVGCAVASGGGDDYLVCRYAPAGNMAGERAF